MSIDGVNMNLNKTRFYNMHCKLLPLILPIFFFCLLKGNESQCCEHLLNYCCQQGGSALDIHYGEYFELTKNLLERMNITTYNRNVVFV